MPEGIVNPPPTSSEKPEPSLLTAFAPAGVNTSVWVLTLTSPVQWKSHAGRRGTQDGGGRDQVDFGLSFFFFIRSVQNLTCDLLGLFILRTRTAHSLGGLHVTAVPPSILYQWDLL